ncbi:hypothetical protein [Enterococcus faecalis]|uniref:hypothetical protein n=1 Tax=Enterococcus faecalis TaxID=1351 RepID=UPI00136CB4C3|nr:hypothetical protein [Enterococcus faecalis]NAA54083.1 hypothetical protein [Enterococcus faecalis]
MKEGRFTMVNLATRETKGKLEDLIEILIATEESNYEDGRFQNGPIMVEIKPTEIENEEQTIKVYIPVNEEVQMIGGDGVRFGWEPEIDIEKVVRNRVPFDEGIEDSLNKLKNYLQGKGLEYEDRLILLFSKIYDEYWVDMVIPYV